MVPLTLPGGKPVIEVPGERPRSPVMVVGPVLVTVEAPRTAKLSAEPSIVPAAARSGASIAPTRLRAIAAPPTNNDLAVMFALPSVALYRHFPDAPYYQLTQES